MSVDPASVGAVVVVAAVCVRQMLCGIVVVSGQSEAELNTLIHHVLCNEADCVGLTHQTHALELGASPWRWRDQHLPASGDAEVSSNRGTLGRRAYVTLAQASVRRRDSSGQ